MNSKVSNAIRFTAEGPKVPKKITLTFNVASSPPSPSVPLVMPLEDTFPEDPAHSLYLFFQVVRRSFRRAAALR